MAGSIVLDLRGHTLSGFTTSSFTKGIGNAYRSFGKPITIKNGTIQNYSLLVSIVSSHYEAAEPVGVVLDHLTFIGPQKPSARSGQAIEVANLNNSTVSNCVFQYLDVGIYDVSSLGGNRYVNNSFFECTTTLQVDLYPASTGVLKNCVFAPWVPAVSPTATDAAVQPSSVN